MIEKLSPGTVTEISDALIFKMNMTYMFLQKEVWRIYYQSKQSCKSYVNSLAYVQIKAFKWSG